MRVKIFFIELSKIILSGAIALAILTLFCMVYYNVPIRYLCEDGVTDCIRKPNKFYSRGTEGFAYGKTNNEGYNNLFDYDENTQVDILVMGSSNMEAYQVAMEETVSSRLNALLKNYTVYNVGMDGHSFIICANNLEAAISKYQPSKYVIIETANVQFSEEDLTNAINGTVPEISSYSGGIIGFLQRNPYLRLINAQRGILMEGKEEIINTKIFKQENNINSSSVEVLSKEDTSVTLSVETGVKKDVETYTKTVDEMPIDVGKEKVKTSINVEDTDSNMDLVNKLLQKMNDIVQVCGAEIIIVYHPRIALNEDGSLLLMTDSEEICKFARLCKDNGVFFLDMSNCYIEEYTKNYIMPNGFSNTSIGSGHMNKYGHAMMADEIYKLIEGEE